MRQHHALGLARRPGGVDDRRELARDGFRARLSRNSRPTPHSPISRACPRSATASSVRTDGDAAAGGSNATIASSDGQLVPDALQLLELLGGRDERDARAGVLDDVARLRRASASSTPAR